MCYLRWKEAKNANLDCSLYLQSPDSNGTRFDNGAHTKEVKSAMPNANSYRLLAVQAPKRVLFKKKESLFCPSSLPTFTFVFRVRFHRLYYDANLMQ